MKGTRHSWLRRVQNNTVPALLLAVSLISAGPLAAAGRVWISLGAVYEGFGGPYFPSGGIGLEPQILVGAWKTMGLRIGGLGFSDWSYNVAQLDVGFWKSFGSAKFPSILMLGFSYKVSSDADGGDTNGPGAHAGFRQELWFGRNLGLYAQGVLRAWFGDAVQDSHQFWPSLGGGLSLRF